MFARLVFLLARLVFLLALLARIPRPNFFCKYSGRLTAVARTGDGGGARWLCSNNLRALGLGFDLLLFFLPEVCFLVCILPLSPH